LMNNSIYALYPNRFKHAPLLVSAVWAFSCMQSENILYMGTLQYQYAATVLFASILVLQKMLMRGTVFWWQWGLLYLFFASGLFAQEMCIVFPLLLFIIMLLYKWNGAANFSWRQFLVLFFVPMALMILFYFCWHHYCYSNWLPHYGQMHLQGYDLPFIAEHLYLNCLKTFFCFNFWPSQMQHSFLAFAKNTIVVVIIFGVIIYLLLMLAKRKQLLSLMICLMLLFGISYAPTANFGSFTGQIITNDRLIFFSRLWMYLILFVGVYCMRQKAAMYFCVLFLCIQICLIPVCAHQYGKAGNYLKAITANIDYKPNEDIFFLNLPHQYKGVMICRYPYSIHHLQYVFANTEMGNHYVSVAREVVQQSSRNFTIAKLSDTTIKINNPQLNNYYNMSGCLAESAVKNMFRATTIEGVNGYTLHLSSALKNARLLYFTGERLQEFKLATDSFVHILHP
jgi:hypothetical protein